jgi:hypothetical protein
LKKVGIVTFHNALSYGAALQSYGLQQFLKAKGIDNDIIDYECEFINQRYKKLINIEKSNVPKSLLGSLLKYKNKKKSLELFANFRENNMVLSKNCGKETIKSLAGDYSAFIAGSDQVWSPTCAGFDLTYFLDFAEPWQKFSYAASLGTKNIPEDKVENYRELLKDFQGVSLRESSGINAVEGIVDTAPQVHIDPTLLLDRNEWDKLSENVKINRPYIFLYNVKKPKRLIDYAVKLGKEKGLEVYYLNDRHFPKIKGLNFLPPVSPRGFVGLIKNAEYVVTNSFHGCAFSLIYHKNVVVELNSENGRNNRIEELFKLLDINGRDISENYFLNPNEKIDWVKTERILSKEKEKSEKYLMSIVGK